MPRIRTIKPEFWSSPDVAKASAVARLAYIGMWNWADDYGRGTLNLKELEGFIFPNDDIKELSVGTSENFRRVVKEVVDTFGIIIYEVHGRTYYAIPTWADHQRTERKAKSKYPAPEDGENVSDQWSDGSSYTFLRAASEVPTQGGGSSRKPEHRNRGTGEQGNRGREGVKETSNPTGGQHPNTENPQPQNLDELAAAHAASQPDPRRCKEHQHLAPGTVPDCGRCAEARRAYEESQKAEKADRRKQRRAAIDACDRCDHNGMRYKDGEAWHCDHQAETSPKHRPEAPQSDKHATHGQSPQNNTQTRQKRKEPPF
nr:MAG TPA: replisome organizer [Caudoviricetes sp.]